MARIKTTLKEYFYSIQLKNKLLWVYFFLIIIPLGFFTLFSFFKVSKAIQNQTLYTSSKTFENTVHLTEETLSQLKNTVNILAHDPLVYRIASHDKRDYPMSSQLQNSDTLKLTFAHLKNITYADNIKLYISNNFLYSEQNIDIFQLNTIDQTEWYQTLVSSDDSNIWFDPGLYSNHPAEEDVFSLAHVIYDPTDVSQLLAILRVDIKKEQFLKIISKTPVTQNSSLLLMDDEQVLISSSYNEKDNLSLELFNKINISQPNTWQLTNLSGERTYLNHSTLQATGWNMVSIIPYDDVFSLNKSLYTELLIIVLLIGIASYLLAYTISSSSLKRVAKLTDSLEKVQSGDLSVNLVPQGNDEIGHMMLAFNHMVKDINVLMEEREENGKEIKNLELKALQAQINPHFLYNSLDLINCIAIEHHIPQIIKMVNSLARFYKLSLNHGRGTISVADELTHTKLYIDIQNLRFDDRITLLLTVDDSLLDCSVVKIILQPIVENAIIHGIFEKDSQTGIIDITVKEKNNTIFLTVKDDGIGMSPEDTKKNFLFTTPTTEDISSASQKGYGVRNIHDRLQLAYGLDYGMTCTSELGVGTVVTLKIPKVTI